MCNKQIIIITLILYFMKSNRAFHHNRIINIATGVVVYSTSAFIVYACIAIVLHTIEHGAPASFGIYG